MTQQQHYETLLAMLRAAAAHCREHDLDVSSFLGKAITETKQTLSYLDKLDTLAD